MEIFDVCKPLGRFVLRVGGESIAGGTVIAASSYFNLFYFILCTFSIRLAACFSTNIQPSFFRTFYFLFHGVFLPKISNRVALNSPLSEK